MASSRERWPLIGTACFLIGFISFGWPPPVLHVSPIKDLNPKVLVMTCSTSKVTYPFDFSVNVCEGQKWRGFGWKMKMLLQGVKKLKNDSLIVMVDGTDSFINRGNFAYRFFDVWDSLNADLVIASEEACSADHKDCDTAMVNALYPRLARTRSAFVNSPLAGKGWALQEALTRLINWGGGINTFDDQFAVTQMANGNIAMPANIRMVHDTKQQLFGSFVHLAKYVKGENIYRRGYRIIPKRFTCTDGGGSAMVFECIDVAVRSRHERKLVMYDGLEYHVNANCDISRVSSLLNLSPVFWHGNGPAKHVFRILEGMRIKCLQQSPLLY